jgi:Zn-finger nucleic acid-binding protein
MRCPVDGTTLGLTERAGVEIDYCPDCRGVWLDRGELERIIERSGTGARRDERPGQYRRDEHEYEYERRHDEEYGHHRHADHEHDRRRPDDDRYGRPGNKRGGALSALTGLLGGGED